MEPNRTLTKTAARLHASLMMHQQAERANLDRTFVGLSECIALDFDEDDDTAAAFATAIAGPN